MKRILLLLIVVFALLLWQRRDRTAETTIAVDLASPSAEMLEPQLLFTARREEIIDGSRHLVRNLLAGPLQIELAWAERQNVLSNPELPLRTTIRGLSEKAVVDILVADPSLPSHYKMNYSAVPGSPHANPDSNAIYAVPFPDATRWDVDQGYHGSFSHQIAEARFAVDFEVPVGTPVAAARAGTVMQVEDQFQGHGQDLARYATRANHIRILHDDGSMADYAHLQTASALVLLGQHVEAGDLLAQSGETGFTTGPHLHFVVQVNRGMRLESIPFRMPGVDTSDPEN